ncbi:hypothetical protein AAHA92_21972 [Salvia divinorum]|uniref:Secreted protein n=1 Tax=Salvia divinorum TaxID=28513 RepID=A0ABD1GM61_SALDI
MPASPLALQPRSPLSLLLFEFPVSARKTSLLGSGSNCSSRVGSSPSRPALGRPTPTPKSRRHGFPISSQLCWVSRISN